MENSDANKRAIEKIAQNMRSYRPDAWDKMPDLELYMDQVITYLTRQLDFFQTSPEGGLVTPSIINNYVKAGFVPRPTKKKYARGQLSALMIACVLKRVMSIQSIKRLIERDGREVDGTFYDAFCKAQQDALDEEAEVLLKQSAEGEMDRQKIYQLATRFALRANADRLVADKLMDMLDDGTRTLEKKQEKKKEADAE